MIKKPIEITKSENKEKVMLNVKEQRKSLCNKCLVLFENGLEFFFVCLRIPPVPDFLSMALDVGLFSCLKNQTEESNGLSCPLLNLNNLLDLLIESFSITLFECVLIHLFLVFCAKYLLFMTS